MARHASASVMTRHLSVIHVRAAVDEEYQREVQQAQETLFFWRESEPPPTLLAAITATAATTAVASAPCGGACDSAIITSTHDSTGS